MTNPHTYSGGKWREALNAAEDHEFCDIDSRVKKGELAGVVCDLRADEAGSDEGLVFAAITVAEKLRGEFDRDFLARVIRAYDEEKTGRLEERAIGFIKGCWPNFPIEYTRSLEAFAVEYALTPNERVADDGTSGPVYLFDVTELLPANE
ncbi:MULTISPECIES: hypothetical protein [Streptomyces]|uniref:hypothetical protein n=1 Tax=Streptomyces TaxID=1883 RepID=UPI0004CDACDB|nr:MULTISPECIES: hypothetical protein [Streptomyces]KOT51136.1 hypothetical protein ADK43_32595 [Streptomyces rimosus subsp. rimosus]